MTISSTTRVAGPFTGNGATATFPFTFKVFDESDLLVIQLDVAAGTISTLALTTDYTVALNADQDATPGGSVTLTAGNLAEGLTLTLTTDIAELQGLDLTNGGGFYPDVINAALDLLTILIQQLQVQVNLSLRAPLGDGTTGLTLPTETERACKLLAFGCNGGLSLVSVLGSGDGTLFGTVDLAPPVPGDFTKAHALPFTPKAVVVQMTSGGQIWMQKDLGYDATNLYLVASDGGVTGIAICFA